MTNGAENKRVEVTLETDYGMPIVRVWVEIPVITMRYKVGVSSDTRLPAYREEIIVDRSNAFIPGRVLNGLTSDQVERILDIAERKLYQEAGCYE